MKRLNFSTNWNNKLDCQFFTSIRLNTDKYVIGEDYIILLRSQKKKTAKLILKKSFKIANLNDFTSYIDTGYSSDQVIEMMKLMYPHLDIFNCDFVLLGFLTNKEI